jgi:hypothetical protein
VARRSGFESVAGFICDFDPITSPLESQFLFLPNGCPIGDGTVESAKGLSPGKPSEV